MAATVPFRVSDLIHKYGWDIMPYLSNLGVNVLCESQVLFVDSGATNASDVDDGEHGHSFEMPLATIDYAIGLCTANEGSVILVAPGHNESLVAAAIDFDVAGVTCIGLGEGTLRPRIDYDNTAASVDIGANNVTLVNLTFLPSVASVLIGVDVESGVTNFKMVNCEFLPYESSGDEFVVAVDLKENNHDTVIQDCKFWTEAAAGASTHGIKLTAGSSRVQIVNNLANGNYSTAFIASDAAVSEILIKGNNMKVKDGEPGIELYTGSTGLIIQNNIESTGVTADVAIVADACSWFDNKCVTVDGSASEIIGGGDIAADLVTYKLDHLAKTACADTSDPVDMSAEVADNTILANVLDDGGDTSSYDRRNHSLVALRNRMDAIDEENKGIRTRSEVYYVNANVVSSGDGLSWANAYKTITEAVAVATVAGDIIYVAPGDYDETATVAITANGISIIGPGPDTQNKAMIYDGVGTGYDLMTINANEVVIDGIAFSAAANNYDGIVIGGSSPSYKVTIRNCRLDGWSGEYGIQAGAVNDCPDLLIENNLFRSWNTAAVQVNCTRSCVRNNIFHVVTDCIGLEHIPAGGDRPDNVYLNNRFSGVANASTTGIKFTGAPGNGTCMCGGNWLFGTWDTSITQVAAYIGIENYAGSTAGGTLVDTCSG